MGAWGAPVLWVTAKRVGGASRVGFSPSHRAVDLPRWFGFFVVYWCDVEFS